MSINATTLSGAVDNTQTQFGVASATGISAPTLTTGAGFTWLLVEEEMMFVYALSGTFVSVLRGQLGTKSSSHAASTPVLAGLPSDFPNFTPAQGAFVQSEPSRFQGVSPPVASATTIIASGKLFHVTGTTATATITPPTNFIEGSITVIADGVWTWTAAGNIVVAGTVTTAGSSVTFTFDRATNKWSPSRLA